MKSTGIVRKVDELGRVVLPIELRRNLGIAEKDGLEIFINDNQIVLQKYQPDTEKQEVINVLKELVDNVKSPHEAEAIARAIKLIK
ncbi:AbrB/MazE/SpoVT family DNA-binding domain-containing protein [Solibacillus sp. FSL R7-0668]|uniref:AbrB/MazE/SpoVT family DNA-binding domain-containing protein n=1 Tax=Solibacillus sp. FSL R7-0668 TaxID=2921688 RepID=UPI0030FBBFF2